MKVLLLPEAAQEFEDAVVYLEEEEPGLGTRLRAEIEAHIGWIIENPTIPRLREGACRRVNLQVFPYYIAYLIKSETIWSPCGSTRSSQTRLLEGSGRKVSRLFE